MKPSSSYLKPSRGDCPQFSRNPTLFVLTTPETRVFPRTSRLERRSSTVTRAKTGFESHVATTRPTSQKTIAINAAVGQYDKKHADRSPRGRQEFEPNRKTWTPAHLCGRPYVNPRSQLSRKNGLGALRGDSTKRRRCAGEDKMPNLTI